jgi:formamidopyrimidine-DNA glycosylase
VPELADVEGFRRVLDQHATGRVIRAVTVADTGVLRGVSATRLRDTLRGRRFRTPRRHGKWLIAPTTGGPVVLFHFGMTGSLRWSPGGADSGPHDRVVFGLAGGDLRYVDQRKLTGIRLLDSEADVSRELGDLGPDAAGLSGAEFRDLLASRRGGVKSALTDQHLLAGLGNLLADEILWRARINPRRACADLDRTDLDRLHRGMGTVLRAAMKAGRVPPRPSWLTGHREEPEDRCPRCGTQLRHGRVNGRGTVWCPRCQAR